MKKLLIALFAFSMVAIPAIAQNTPAPLSAVVGGAIWSDDKFTSIGGSLVLGPQFSIDADKGFQGRVTYHRINVGAPAKQSLDLTLLSYWYVGDKWNFYVGPGFDAGLSEGTGNNWTFGVGIERAVMTVKSTAYIVPFSINAFAEATSTDDATQIMIGIRLAKPVKK